MTNGNPLGIRACQFHLIAGEPTPPCKHVAVLSQTDSKLKFLLCKYHLDRIGYASPRVRQRLAEKREAAVKVRRRTKRVREKDEYDRRISDLQRQIKRLEHDVAFWKNIEHPERKPAPINGFIYIIRPSNGGYIKIGWTSDLERRMREYAPDTTILAVMPGTRKDEHRMHKKFAHLRTHGREWYPLAPQILEEARYIVMKHGEPPTLDFSAREAKTPFMGNRINKRNGPTPRGWSGVA